MSWSRNLILCLASYVAPLAFCGSEPNTQATLPEPPSTATAVPPPPKAVRDGQGRIELLIPNGYSKIEQQEPWAEIYLGNGFKQAYLWVMSEPREDLAEGMTLEQYVRDRDGWFASHLERPARTDVEFFNHNGQRAASMEVRGEQAGTKWVYLVTVIETENRFNIVFASTRPSRFDKLREELQSISRSLREVKPAESVEKGR